MAQSRKTVIRGITEVGAKRGGSDVSFGRTAPNGFTMTFSGNDLEVESGQSTFLETLFRTADRIDWTFRLLYADLLNLKDMLGLPASALTGDLWGGTPTAEVLAIIEGTLGSVEDTLYAITPGPKSTRRYEAQRAALRAGLTIEHSKDNHVILEATWTILRPASGNIITITDNV